MTLFLFKPHVAGPENAITSPDIIVDRLFVDGNLKPLNFLTMELAHQVEAGEGARAAYALTAAGGGPLISPAIILNSGRIVVARKAWRLGNLIGHIGSVTLNGQSLDDIGSPLETIRAAGGSDGVLPRGVMAIRSAAVAVGEALLADPVLCRSLTHRPMLSDVSDDAWGANRPRPRYSVGPTTKEVQHYI